MKMIKKLRTLTSKHWGISVGIFFVTLLVFGYTFYAAGGDTSQTISKDNYSPKEVATISGKFEAPYITAGSAIVWDVRANRAIFQKNSTVPKPLASITKVMTALIAFENVPSNTAVTIDSVSLQQDGESSLVAGERWKLKDLIDFSLVESSNDGMTAVASAVGAISEGLPDERGLGRVSFIDMMNQKARELNLKNTSFENESGLDIYNETEAGAFGSAEDVAKLFSYVLTKKPEVLEATTYPNISVRSLSGSTQIAKNTNQALADIPGLIASKTGYTDISGGNLAIIMDPGINYPIVIVVLGSTYENRFSDVVALSEATLDYFSPNIQ